MGVEPIIFVEVKPIVGANEHIPIPAVLVSQHLGYLEGGFLMVHSHLNDVMVTQIPDEVQDVLIHV